MRTLLAITKALSDANRVRILCALKGRSELCVCQINELLALAPSTTSKNLGILAAAGLVETRKDGRWVYYRLTGKDEAPHNALEVIHWICRQASKQRAIGEDRRKLDEILSYSPEELCQRQAKGLACCSSAPAARAAARSRKGTQGRSKAA